MHYSRMDRPQRALTRSPTVGLLVGLIVTVAAVAADSWYLTRQLASLRALQTDLADRNRKNSLQLLRIQNDLNTIALAMRDMLETGDYPLIAWTAQLARVRTDLDAAMQQEERVAVARRTPEQRAYLTSAVTQFWDAVDRMFASARDGKDDDARAQIRLTLEPRQASLSTAVARLLVENNESEQQTAQQVQAIYGQLQRQAYLFLTGALVVIVLTSLYVIRANRRLFAELAELSNRRHELAQQLIAARESTLREIARELHDELGQLLTAIGSMLGRAGKQAPEGSPLRAELREAAEVAQTALDSVRGLSQTLHPSILEDAGLDDTLRWYVSQATRQLGVTVHYERAGSMAPVDSRVGIQVYRVLQEALSNVARHSGATEAWVRLLARDDALDLEVEDRGRGLDRGVDHNVDRSVNRNNARRGLGIVTMRERAELIGGTIAFVTPPGGGTLVRLHVPTSRPGISLGGASSAPTVSAT
jgi:signal transduction histidine kinase